KFYFPKYKEDRGMEERLLDKIIEENFTITNISSYAKQLVPYVEMIDAQVSSKEKTTRANLMNYGLEIFVPDYKVNAGDDRLKIIYSVKDTLKN
ncbi:hypothetical protein KJ988_08855, partial [bacterium]|nr:hypothetical protein [bacterium]